MICTVYISILSLMFIALSINVTISRRKFKIALGYDNLELARKNRAQSNFIEYSMIFMFLLYLNEQSNVPLSIINSFGIMFIVGRVSHAYSILYNEKYINGSITHNPIYRIFGMVISFSSIITLAILLPIYSLK